MRRLPALVAILMASPALAQAPAAKSASAADKDSFDAVPGDRGNLNQIVCQRYQEPGSRLRAHIYCLRVWQWQMLDQEEKQNTEDIQMKVEAPSSG